MSTSACDTDNSSTDTRRASRLRHACGASTKTGREAIQLVSMGKPPRIGPWPDPDACANHPEPSFWTLQSTRRVQTQLVVVMLVIVRRFSGFVVMVSSLSRHPLACLRSCFCVFALVLPLPLLEPVFAIRRSCFLNSVYVSNTRSFGCQVSHSEARVHRKLSSASFGFSKSWHCMYVFGFSPFLRVSLSGIPLAFSFGFFVHHKP